MNIIINNKKFQHIVTRRLCKLKCVNCGTFYIGRTNRNFKAKIKEQKWFIFDEGYSNFGNHKTEEGHEMRNMDDLMNILHKKQT